MRLSVSILFIIFFLVRQTAAQDYSIHPELEAQINGGKDELEQVLQTQLSLPKGVLTSNFNESIYYFFDIDSAGRAVHLRFRPGLNNIVRQELTRITNFLSFKRTQSAVAEQQPYFLSVHLSTDKYNKYYKQRSKLVFKKHLPADTSFVVYTRADKSPEYFKGGDEGLAEFMLSELEYPKLAKEKSIEGTVVLEFVVETNGYVTSAAARQGVNGGCTDEALRLIKLTKWHPAILNGKYVRYKTTYPVTFSLRNTTKEGTGTIGQ